MTRVLVLLTVLAALLGAGPVAGATVVEYDLGAATLPQPGATGSLAELPVRLQGVIGVPDAPGARPVVVLLHGAHGTGCPEREQGEDVIEEWPCPEDLLRHDIGFSYLVETLAGAGFVALSIDVNAADTDGWGPPRPERALQLLDGHLARLAIAAAGGENAFGPVLAGRVDLARLGLVGQGPRGEQAIVAARQRLAAAQPSATGLGPVSSLLLLAPARERRRAELPDVPLAVVLPECDTAFPGLDGQVYVEQARRARRSALAVAVVLRGGTHAFLNAGLGDDAIGSERTPCRRASQRLAKWDEQDWLAAYASAWFETTLDTASRTLELGLDEADPVPSRLFGRKVLLTVVPPAAARLVLLAPRAGVSLARTDAGGRLVRRGPVELGRCTPARTRPCLRGLWQPPAGPQLVLAWNRVGGALRAELSGPTDVSGFGALGMHVLVDPTDARNARGRSQALSLVLQDAAGRKTRVRLGPAAPALAYPAGAFGEGSAPVDLALSGDVRVPLARFGRVDLTRIVAVELRLDRTPAGALLLSDLQFAS